MQQAKQVTVKFFFFWGGGEGGWRKVMSLFSLYNSFFFPCLGGRVGTGHQLVPYKALKTLSISAKSGR